MQVNARRSVMNRKYADTFLCGYDGGGLVGGQLGVRAGEGQAKRRPLSAGLTYERNRSQRGGGRRVRQHGGPTGGFSSPQTPMMSTAPASGLAPRLCACVAVGTHCPSLTVALGSNSKVLALRTRLFTKHFRSRYLGTRRDCKRKAHVCTHFTGGKLRV